MRAYILKQQQCVHVHIYKIDLLQYSVDHVVIINNNLACQPLIRKYESHAASGLSDPLINATDRLKYWSKLFCATWVIFHKNFNFLMLIVGDYEIEEAMIDDLQILFIHNGIYIKVA